MSRECIEASTFPYLNFLGIFLKHLSPSWGHLKSPTMTIVVVDFGIRICLMNFLQFYRLICVPNEVAHCGLSNGQHRLHIRRVVPANWALSFQPFIVPRYLHWSPCKSSWLRTDKQMPDRAHINKIKCHAPLLNIFLAISFYSSRPPPSTLHNYRQSEMSWRVWRSQSRHRVLHQQKEQKKKEQAEN